MASGCINGGTNGSVSSVLFQKLTPDTKVKYTGPAYPQFGICTGDLLSEIELAILTQIEFFAEGKGITITDIDLTTCDCFQKKVGCCGATACQTLICILQAYLECMCEMYADVQDLKIKVAAMYDGPYATGCLTSVTPSSKLPAIIQAIVVEFCALKTIVTNLQTQINNLLSGGFATMIGDFMKAAILTCNGTRKTGSGSSFKVNIGGFPPIGTVSMIAASGLGQFGSDGKGLPDTDACGWALADGRNGTINMSGRFPLGTDTAHPQGTTGGGTSVTLSGGNVPSMGFSGSTSGSTASFTYYVGARAHTTSASPNDMLINNLWDDGSGPHSMSMSFPGQTFSGSVGSGSPAPINVMPPYLSVNFIQRMY